MVEAHPRRHLVTFERTGTLGSVENQSGLLSVVSPAVRRFPPRHCPGTTPFETSASFVTKPETLHPLDRSGSLST
jgi:hypothetical protein